MRTIITGSKATLGDVKIATHLSKFVITELVSGAEGVDLIAEKWARERKIPITQYPPNKEAWPKAHYQIRNGVMTCAAEAIIFLSDGDWNLLDYNPTADIHRCMEELGKKIYIHSL